jgi:hypothetical protein
MGNEQTKQLQQKTTQLTASKEKVTSINHGFRVAVDEKLKIATIPETVMDAQFLNDNNGSILVVSAKDARDANNETLKEGYYKVDRKRKEKKSNVLIRSTWDEVKHLNWDERLYISHSSEGIIKKTQEDGKERLLALDLGYTKFLGGGLCAALMCVDSKFWFRDDARVAGKHGESAQAAKALRVEKGEVLEVTLHDGKKIHIDASAAKSVKRH